MSDPRDPAVPEGTPLDELASALVDGEATPDERARTDEPDVAARVASFEAIAARVGAPVDPPSDTARDALIARVLASSHEVTSLDEHRRRRGLPAWVPAVASVAAVALALVGLAAFLGSTADDGDDADTASGEAATDATAATEGAADDAGDSAANTTLAGPSSDGGAAEFDQTAQLGEFASTEELVEALLPEAEALRDDAGAGAGDDDTSETSQRAVVDADLPCLDQLGPGLVVATYTATVDGAPVVVGILDNGEEDSYRVLDASTCAELTSGAL